MATSRPLPATTRVPRLTGDAARAWIALGISVVPAGVVGFATGRSTSTGTEAEFLRGQLLVVLTTMVAYFAIYALLTWLAFRHLEGRELERVLRATRTRRTADKLSLALSGGGATSWSVSAALLSLGVVVLIAFQPFLRADPLVLLAGGLLVVTSWVVVSVTFAVHYLRTDADRGGLDFPGDEPRAFSDYVYLALQISTTYSSSDVAVTTRAMRRRVGRHTLVAFVFNSVIIALLVSALLVGVSG